MKDGSAQCWGNNDHGQLGDGTTGDHAYPAPVVGLAGVAQMAMGLVHACAVLLDGSVVCWGSNNKGQLGDGTTEDRPIPTRVSL